MLMVLVNLPLFCVNFTSDLGEGEWKGSAGGSHQHVVFIGIFVSGKSQLIELRRMRGFSCCWAKIGQCCWAAEEAGLTPGT